VESLKWKEQFYWSI